MSDTVLRIDRLGKRYGIGLRQPYYTLRDVMASALRAPIRPFWGTRSEKSPDSLHYIWALKDVSFEVKQGEIVGFVGRNGAGKSTLLKILARITRPTEGHAIVHGRVGSLLEVGTGFHGELTGRENIYLNGAILGMGKKEIRRKFDQIVAFAEVEKFLDTPVKYYSSGMYVRLGFAVAAHLEPEILLVDEVLAVGDAPFQKKCLERIRSMAKEGRTVIFVSHNMAVTESLCHRCLLLARGHLESEGSASRVVARYLASGLEQGIASKSLSWHLGRTEGSNPIMTEVMVSAGPGEAASPLVTGGALMLQVRFMNRSGPIVPVLGVVFKTVHGMSLFAVNNRFSDGIHCSGGTASGLITCRIERLPLLRGTYILDLHFGDLEREYDVIHDALSFEVWPGDGSGMAQQHPDPPGSIFCQATWTVCNGSEGTYSAEGSPR